MTVDNWPQYVAIAVIVFLSLCGAVSVIIGAVNNVKGLSSSKIKAQKTLEALVADHAQMLDNDNKRIKGLEAGNQMTLKCMSVLIDHEITGNSIERLKKTREELNQYLIER